MFSFLLIAQSLAYARYIAIKQRYTLHTNTNTPAMISTYNRVLNTIKKTLWELVEKYWGFRKFLWDLVEGQERNTSQFVVVTTSHNDQY